MISAALLGRYARALADVASETGEEEQVSADIELYGRIFETVPEFLEAVSSPALPRERRQNLLSKILALHPVCGTASNFLQVLLAHNRLRHFAEVAEHYRQVVNERKGILAAKVTASGPVSADQMAKLREGLSRATGKSVQLELDADPELLGGLVVQVGSTVYDGSVRRQLVEIRERLRAAR